MVNEAELPMNDSSMEGGSTGATSSCSLQCQNGGTCVIGQQDQTTEYRFWADPSTTEYCQCSDNWDGPYCDIPRVKCGDGPYCFYGSTCEQEEIDGQTLHYCDCRSAETDNDSYAGRFCQYAATEFCTKEPTPDGHLFCTNQGTVGFCCVVSCCVVVGLPYSLFGGVVDCQHPESHVIAFVYTSSWALARIYTLTVSR